jgi:hypothetical protein
MYSQLLDQRHSHIQSQMVGLESIGFVWTRIIAVPSLHRSPVWRSWPRFLWFGKQAVANLAVVNCWWCWCKFLWVWPWRWEFDSFQEPGEKAWTDDLDSLVSALHYIGRDPESKWQYIPPENFLCRKRSRAWVKRANGLSWAEWSASEEQVEHKSHDIAQPQNPQPLCQTSSKHDPDEPEYAERNWKHDRNLIWATDTYTF